MNDSTWMNLKGNIKPKKDVNPWHKRNTRNGKFRVYRINSTLSLLRRFSDPSGWWCSKETDLIFQGDHAGLKPIGVNLSNKLFSPEKRMVPGKSRNFIVISNSISVEDSIVNVESANQQFDMATTEEVHVKTFRIFQRETTFMKNLDNDKSMITIILVANQGIISSIP